MWQYITFVGARIAKISSVILSRLSF